MTPASSTSLDLAAELLALGTAHRQCSVDDVSATDAGSADDTMRVCQRLRGVLTAFAGAAGFRSLLMRALALAKAQDPSLAQVNILSDGTLAGLEIIRSQSGTGKAKAGAGGTVLVAHLLDLLIVFIGKPLTHQLVRSAWPELPTDALRSSSKDIS